MWDQMRTAAYLAATALLLADASYATTPVAPPPPLAVEKRPAERVVFPEIHDWNSLAITLERHACNGPCPVYRVTLHGDGTVDYEGKAFVALKGVHRANIASYKVKLLFERFRKADFFWAQNDYAAAVIDNETQALSLAFDGHSKRIYDSMGETVGMPPVIQALEDEVDRLSGVERWTKGNSETAAALQAENWNFRDTACTNETLLKGVIVYGTVNAVKDVIELGAALGTASPQPVAECKQEPYYFDDVSFSALAHAANRGDVEMTKAVLAAGGGKTEADVRFAISYGAGTGNGRVLEVLHARWRELTGKSKITDATGALHNAAAVCSVDAVRYLLENGDGLDFKSGEAGASGALIAASNPPGVPYAGDDPADCADTIHFLLKAGADPNVRDKDGNTPLMQINFGAGVTWALLQGGADPNARNNNGETVLMYRFLDDEVVAMLLDAGADPYAKDSSGQTVFDRAKDDHDLNERVAIITAWLKSHPKK